MNTLIKSTILALGISFSGLTMANGELPLGISGWDTQKSALEAQGLEFIDCLGGELTSEVCYLDGSERASNTNSRYRVTFGARGDLRSIIRIITPSSADSDATIISAYAAQKDLISGDIGSPDELRDSSGDGLVGNPSLVQNWYSMWANDSSTVRLQVATKIIQDDDSMGYRLKPVLHVSYRETHPMTEVALNEGFRDAAM